MNQVQIGNYNISAKNAPFIIAEAGINHNGELKKALEMIMIAKSCGANAIKFQTFKADEFVSDPNQMYTYTSQGKKITESMLEMFKRHEFLKEEWIKIKKKCDEEKIMFLSTPLNKSDLDFLMELDIPAIKLGSGDLTNIPFLKYCSTTRLPIIISCGMATLSEISQALNAIGIQDRYPLILLLTTSEYPTPPENVHLLKMRTLSEEFPKIPLGFSDHTRGQLASSLAVAFGACVFEKHFTLDHDLPGPDHWFSEEPADLQSWVNAIKTAHIMMGNPIVQPTEKEKQNKKDFRKVIVAGQHIKSGEILNSKNIAFKRVEGGKGLSPVFYEKIVGKKASKDYLRGASIEE